MYVLNLTNITNQEPSINIIDKSSTDFIYKHENLTVNKIYNTLKTKRLYSIGQIGSFKLMRNDIDDLQKTVLGNWEFYTKNTPCWIQRLHIFKASFSTDNKIVFENDDMLEEFYELYGYEPDEQSKKIQQQSIGLINDETWNTWYNLYFTNDVCIKLYCNFKFIY